MSLARGGYNSRWRASGLGLLRWKPEQEGAFIAWGSGAWRRPRSGGDGIAANPETPESGDPFLSRGDPFETPTSFRPAMEDPSNSLKWRANDQYSKGDSNALSFGHHHSCHHKRERVRTRQGGRSRRAAADSQGSRALRSNGVLGFCGDRRLAVPHASTHEI